VLTLLLPFQLDRARLRPAAAAEHSASLPPHSLRADRGADSRGRNTIDRQSGATTEIAGRLLGGDAVVLFAEGTSSDGNRVLPFRSALVGAVHHAFGNSTQHTSIIVQPMSQAYVGFGGVPMGRALRGRKIDPAHDRGPLRAAPPAQQAMPAASEQPLPEPA
jgi:1-acyl-sn-glycerol-3-phosphate acyltransferase